MSTRQHVGIVTVRAGQPSLTPGLNVHPGGPLQPRLCLCPSCAPQIRPHSPRCVVLSGFPAGYLTCPCPTPPPPTRAGRPHREQAGGGQRSLWDRRRWQACGHRMGHPVGRLCVWGGDPGPFFPLLWQKGWENVTQPERAVMIDGT